MRALGKVISVLRRAGFALVGLAALGASSCGARTSLSERGDPAEGSGTPGRAVGGSGGVGGGVLGTDHPVISSSPGSFIQSETSVSRSPKGFVAVVWIDITMKGEARIGYTISSDDGASFPPPSFASSPDGRLASDPVITVDTAGNFYMAWVGYFADAQGSTSDMHIYVSRASAGSTSFEAPIEASDPALSNQLHDKPWITITADDSLVVTYAVATGAQSKLIAAIGKDGVSWNRSVILQGTTAFWNLAFPCAPRQGKRLWVSYLAFSPTDEVSVGLTWSDDGGVSWLPLLQNTTVNLPDEHVAFDDPGCVADGEDVWVSYGLTKDPFGEEESDKSFAVRLAHSGDGGATIDARIDAHDPAAAAFFLHPQMTMEDSGAIDLVYYAGNMDKDLNGAYRWSRAESPAKGFGPSEVIEAPVVFFQDRDKPPWLGDYTGLFWAGDQLYTSYVVNTTGKAHVAFARVATQ
jgi:hypothetical protein